jgi:hypothetical protein
VVMSPMLSVFNPLTRGFFIGNKLTWIPVQNNISTHICEEHMFHSQNFRMHHDTLICFIDEAIDLSNTHHGFSEFFLVSDFTCMLGIVFESWMGLILEIQIAAQNIPQKADAASQWTKEYQILLPKVARAFALFIQAKYADGRLVLNEVRTPLQNIAALVISQLYQYEAE